VKKLKQENVMHEDLLAKEIIGSLLFPVPEEIVFERMNVLVKRLFF
jgi:hypothetical protein